MKSTNTQTGHDAPVWMREEDFYGRWPLATSISRIIATAPAEWSTRIGLFAPWGDGKTSVLNFLEQQQKKAGNIVIRYTPWGASTPEEVWKDFGIALIQGLKRNGVSTAFWRRALHWAIAKKAPLQKTVRMAGTLADASGYVIGGAAGAEFASTVIEEKLTFTGKDIKQLTAQLGSRRVVVFIDDLDRTDDALVPKLLLVLRELLDFAQFAFVLTFDRKIVAAALENSNPSWVGSGTSFLNKVIDFPIELPQPTPSQIKRLASYQFESLCPFVPTSSVEKLASNFPANPRKLKLLARTIASMEAEVSRHDTDELDWNIILLTALIRAESEPFASRLLDLTIEKGDFDWEEHFADDRDAKQKRKDEIEALFNEFPELQGKSKRMHVLVKAWLKAVPTYAGERIRYQAMFALSPHCITWGEFKKLLLTWREQKDYKLISAFLKQRADASEEHEDVVANEFAGTIINHYSTILEKASGVQSKADHSALMEEACDVLELLLQSLASKPALVQIGSDALLSIWEKMRDVALQWRHFNSNQGEPQLRDSEVTTLIALGIAISNPMAIYDKVRPNIRLNSALGRRETELKANMFATLRLQFEPEAVNHALLMVAQPGELEKLDSNDENQAARFLLASPKSPLFATDKARLMSALEARRGTVRVVEDSHAFLEILLAALDHGDGWVCSAEDRKKFITEHPDFMKLVWEVSVSEPSQFRMLQSLRDHRKKLILSGVPEDMLTVPDWLNEGLERGDIPS